MIKRFLTLSIIFLSLGVSGRVFAQSQFAPVITKMEKSLFGTSYDSQNDEARIKRIEESVYGVTSSQPLSQRVSKLSKDLSADSIGQEIKPKADTFEEEDDGYKAEVPKADPNVNYPIVNKLEERVFSKDFKTLDINKRLSNLEQKTFNRVYNDDLNSRVERLKASVLGVNENTSVADADDDYSSSSSSSDSYSDFPTGAAAATPRDLLSRGTYYGPSFNQNNSVLDGSQQPGDMFGNDLGQGVMSNGGDSGFDNGFDDGFSGGQGYGIGVPLSALEQSVLRKSFPDDTVSNRLTRLEAKMFNSSFVQDDPQTRLERLASANQAKKTSKKYDSNKFSQRASTAVQIGALLLMVLAFVL